MSSPNLWGGQIHRVIKYNQGVCFECGGPLRIGEYIHTHFGGMVMIHCKCSHKEIEIAIP